MAWPRKNSDRSADAPSGSNGELSAYRELELANPEGRVRLAERWLRRALDRAVDVQTAPAQAYVRRLRSSHPDESPAQVAERLDKNLVRAVGTAGTAAGATATVPGIGTLASFGAIGADAVAFLEAVTFHTIAKATVYGVDVSRRDQRELLVSIILLGSTGNAIVERAAHGRKGKSVARKATELPELGRINSIVFNKLVRGFVFKRLKGSFAKILPAGIGAVLGGWGNVKAGKLMVSRSKEAFGVPPTTWPSTPELEAAKK